MDTGLSLVFQYTRGISVIVPRINLPHGMWGVFDICPEVFALKIKEVISIFDFNELPATLRYKWLIYFMGTTMTDPQKVWKAIYELAKLNNLTLSGLAKKAGMDKTSFNKSKQFYKTGQPRWPSVETINKILHATKMNWDDFCNLLK